ncbi:MAG TPA: hypothetical protein VK973_15260 [Arenicellales bacterium]|nr:hypothetical protein [Arenicellales bacterium]
MVYPASWDEAGSRRLSCLGISILSTKAGQSTRLSGYNAGGAAGAVGHASRKARDANTKNQKAGVLFQHGSIEQST